MQNILSIDFEDWHHLIYRKIAGGPLRPPSAHVERQTDRLLDLLDRHETKATFFVLGALAEHEPGLVRRIAGEGHEIASHGYEHLRVYDMTPEAFAEDLKRSKDVLEDLTGEPVEGFRAPEFSIRRDTFWALDVLAEQGFRYDSSIFPIRHRRYGIAGFDPAIRRYATPGGAAIVEAPLATFPIGRTRVPVAGGGYFRYLPHAILEYVVAALNAEDQPFVTYFHPYEFDDRSLDIFEMLEPGSAQEWLRAWQINLHQNVGRAGLIHKLDGLLGRFSFGTFREYLATTFPPRPVTDGADSPTPRPAASLPADPTLATPE